MTTINTLLNALEGSQGITAVKKQFNDIDNNNNTPKFIDKLKSSQIERSLVYQNTSNDISKWQDIVIQNRHKKTLSLVDDKSSDLTFKSLINKYEPTNKMEKNIQMILLTNGSNEKEVEIREEDELISKGLSYEDIKQKQDELAKVKSRLFYEQIKRHRINKIKSKLYHRIKKKQKERKANEDLQLILETDPDKAKDLLEDKAMKRIKERMDLKHKNTGKWAKMALEHGRRDKSLRESYHEAIQLGRELVEKANNNSSNDNKDNSDDDSIDISDDDESNHITHKAAKLLNELANEQQNNYEGKYNKLFDMTFMKKGAELVNKQIKEETKQIILDLNEAENQIDSDDEVITTSQSISESNNIDFNESFHHNSLSINKNRKKIKSSSSLNVDIASNKQVVSKSYNDEINQIDEILDKDMTGDEFDQSNETTKNKKNKNKSKSKANKKVNSNTSIQSNHLTDNKVDINSTNNVTAGDNANTNNSNKPVNEKKSLLQQKSQNDLIQLAFAGPDLQEEFEKYKNQSIDDELGFNDQRKQVLSKVKAGWGDWAGPGNMLVSSKIQSIRDRQMLLINTKEEEIKKQRIDNKLPTVMISELRNKAAAKYMLTAVPHPFTSREEYERSLQMPIGEEWNSSRVVKDFTKPSIITRPGRVIEPIKLPKKRELPSLDEKLNTKRSKYDKFDKPTVRKVVKIQ